MINLIKNEYIKIGVFKLITISIILILIMFCMHFLDININEKLIDFIPYISLIIVSIFGGIVSNEYQSGTIRFYLTKPINRIKILISKLLTMIFYTLLLLIVVLTTCILITKNVNITLIKDFFFYSIPLIFINVLTLYISTNIKSSSLSTTILIIFLFTSNLITELFLLLKLKIVIYTPLPYIDFNIYINKEVITAFNNLYNTNLNLNSGVIIILVYSVITLLLALILFNKKDIKS